MIGSVQTTASGFTYFEFNDGVVHRGRAWRTAKDGYIMVSADPTIFSPLTNVQNARSPIGDVANMRFIVDTYGPIVLSECNRDGGCPIDWAFACIQVESHGAVDKSDAAGGIGPMQITAKGLKAGYTDEELRDPKLNLSIGIGVLRGLWAHGVREYPVAASIYNAGGSVVEGRYVPHTSLHSPWGMAETPGHIMRSVLAYNAFRELVRLGEYAIIGREGGLP